MNEITAPAIEFEKEISKLKINSRKIFALGLVLILFSALFLILVLETHPNIPNNETGENNSVIGQKTNSTIVLQRISILILAIGVISIYFQTIQLRKSIATKKVIKTLYQIYGIKIIENYKGTIKITDIIDLKIEWSTKGFFIIKCNSKVLSFASSSELYWKIIYFSYKFKLLFYNKIILK